MKKLLFILLFTQSVFAQFVNATQIDWKKIKYLEDKNFLSYFYSLNLKGQEALDFWKKIPISRANKQINRIFRREAFSIYMKKYPRINKRIKPFSAGIGTNIAGPISGQNLKLPFTSYYQLAEGPIGDPDKTYHIGYTIHGLGHPWLLNNADSAVWEANRHSNVKLTVLDPEFDNKKQVKHIDDWVKNKLDGILIWPMQEAPTGAPVSRAYKAGIPSVTVDRLVGSKKVQSQVTGNFPANGAQQAIYLIDRLLREKGEVKAKILMIRKPLGSTADAMRTGHFLKILSYFPQLQILESKHNKSNRNDSKEQVSDALVKYPDIDVIFCTGAEQAMGAVLAVDKAKRWDSRENNRRIIILSNDDLHEALLAMKEDKIAMVSPYTPLLGALGLRILLKHLSGEKVSKNISTPDLPMITQHKQEILGIQTMSIEEWLPYSYGRK